MGGSGGGYTFSFGSNPSELQKQIRQAELAAAEVEFGPTLAKRLSDLLARVNDRDTAKTEERLQIAKELLRDEIDGAFDLKFGGSVAKHTYVDGLSDVDTLLIMKGDGEADTSPQAMLARLVGALARNLSGDVVVTKGRLAITLRYPDGEEIQIVPSIRRDNRLHVPAWNANEWSAIDPEKFRSGLTKRNAACGMKLVPTIKLAKAINATLPEPQQLTGYHIESMAIAAFRGYAGPAVVEKMLPYFFEKMKDLVRSPMRDTTGQSVHVDTYLGKTNSVQRQQMSHLLDRIARRMENATAAKSIAQWDAILGEQ